jgi:hypothetical protein
VAGTSPAPTGFANGFKSRPTPLGYTITNMVTGALSAFYPPATCSLNSAQFLSAMPLIRPRSGLRTKVGSPEWVSDGPLCHIAVHEIPAVEQVPLREINQFVRQAEQSSTDSALTIVLRACGPGPVFALASGDLDLLSDGVGASPVCGLRAAEEPANRNDISMLCPPNT